MARPKKNAPVEQNGTEGQTVVETTTPEQVASETKPTINDVGWTDYVLSLLDKKTELSQDKPKAAGLRRIFSQVTNYDVVESYPTVVQAPTPENERRATVMFTLAIRDRNLPTDTLRFADVSDCYWGNTGTPFNRHPVATAATMAEGRVLRKIMKLNVVTAEETLAPSVQEDIVNEILTDAATPIDRPAAIAIEAMCNRLGIDERKLLMLHKMPVPEDITEKPTKNLSKKDGQMMVQICAAYQNGAKNNGLDIPDEIKRGNK